MHRCHALDPGMPVINSTNLGFPSQPSCAGGELDHPRADRHRRVLDGIFWIARTGAPWRDLPEELGNWNSVWRQFRRWSASGLWDGEVRRRQQAVHAPGQSTAQPNYEGHRRRSREAAQKGRAGRLVCEFYRQRLCRSHLPRRPDWQFQHFAERAQICIPWSNVIRFPKIDARRADADLFSNFGNR